MPRGVGPEGGGGGGDRLGWGHIRILYKAPEDYTKPQLTIQSPDRLYKAPTDNTKAQQDYARTPRIRQRLKISNKDLKYQTRVATDIKLTL